MSEVHIGEITTTIEPAAGAGAPASAPAEQDSGPAFEVQLEELRPLVRALVAEELERRARREGRCP